MRVAIIGAGTQGRQHVKAFRAAGAEIGGIAAGSKVSAVVAASRLGLSAYASTDAAIADPRIDAVVVATPTATHAELTMAALRAGKHVLCEVPVARDAPEARAMEHAATHADRILQAGLLHRFESVWTTFVEIVRMSALGRPVHLTTERLSAFPADGLMRSHYGDAIDELLAFDIHLLLWVLGPAEQVVADATWRNGRAIDVAATFVCGGIRATCFATEDMPSGYPFTERAVATLERGSIEALNRFWPDRIETQLVCHTLDGAAEVVSLTPHNVLIEQARYFMEACYGRVDSAYAGFAHARAVLDVVQTVRNVSGLNRS